MAIQYGFRVATIVTLGRTHPRRTDTRMDSTWRWVSGAVPVPRSRTDEVTLKVRRYPSGVITPAPLSWYAETMRIEPLSRVRSTVNGRMTPGSWAKWTL